VHDFLLDLRGAERVFATMCDMWPEADIFTAVYDEKGTQGRFAHRNVRTSFVQRLHPRDGRFRLFMPLYPLAMERLELDGYDLVVSSSSAWAHGVIAPEAAVHVCYCHNPFRYAWRNQEANYPAVGSVLRAGLEPIFRAWRAWDRRAAGDVDRYVANSETTRARIGRCFGREAAVVHPPVQTSRFAPAAVDEVDDYFLIVSKLMPHKHTDIAVRAFNRLRRRLVIVGDGPDERRLRNMAGPNIEFTGRVSDERVAQLLRRCAALVVPAVEEFGIAAVEAQASGRPVLACDAGGVRESVIDGITGSFYSGDDPGALALAAARFDPRSFDPRACVDSAARFDVARFAERLRDIVRDAREFSRPPSPRRSSRRLGVLA
jgi:glycosyltransferase involved in cell wall biosynthesis